MRIEGGIGGLWTIGEVMRWPAHDIFDGNFGYTRRIGGISSSGVG